jgi:hypothetical protein
MFMLQVTLLPIFLLNYFAAGLLSYIRSLMRIDITWIIMQYATYRARSNIYGRDARPGESSKHFQRDFELACFSNSEGCSGRLNHAILDTSSTSSSTHIIFFPHMSELAFKTP